MPTLVSVSRPPSLIEWAISILASIVFTQQRRTRTTNNNPPGSRPYSNNFDCEKALESVMLTNIGCRLGTTILSTALMGSVGILNSRAKGLNVFVNSVCHLQSSSVMWALIELNNKIQCCCFLMYYTMTSLIHVRMTQCTSNFNFGLWWESHLFCSVSWGSMLFSLH